jgi:hypothetical protein
MSKGIKKKHIAKLLPGQVCLVFDSDIALHIAETYDFVSMDAEEEYIQYYKDVADSIRLQVQETYYDGGEGEYDEWQ